jgi:hypothetical protein
MHNCMMLACVPSCSIFTCAHITLQAKLPTLSGCLQSMSKWSWGVKNGGWHKHATQCCYCVPAQPAGSWDKFEAPIRLHKRGGTNTCFSSPPACCPTCCCALLHQCSGSWLLKSELVRYRFSSLLLLSFAFVTKHYNILCTACI